MTARGSNSSALAFVDRRRAGRSTDVTASYPPRRHSSATGAPDAARWPTSGPDVRPATSARRGVRRGCGSARRPRSARPGRAGRSPRRSATGSASVIPAALGDQPAGGVRGVVASRRAAANRLAGRWPMEASSVRSACARTASPALMPAAVRSSWARSSRSIQRSSADSSRYCWSTMRLPHRGVDEQVAPPPPRRTRRRTARCPAAPASTGCRRRPRRRRRRSGRPAAPRRGRARPRPTPSAKAYSSGLGAASGCRTGCGCRTRRTPRSRVLGGWYSSRSAIRRSTQSCSGRPTRVCWGPSTGPSSSVPASRRPRKCQWPCCAASTANRSMRAGHDEPQHLRPLQRQAAHDRRSRPACRARPGRAMTESVARRRTVRPRPRLVTRMSPQSLPDQLGVRTAGRDQVARAARVPRSCRGRAPRSRRCRARC